MLRGESDEGPHPKREDEQVPLFTCCMVTLQARDPLRLSVAIRAQVQNLSISRVKRGFYTTLTQLSYLYLILFRYIEVLPSRVSCRPGRLSPQ